MVNLKMVRYYRSSYLDLPVALVDCQMKVCELRLHHVWQGGYLDMHAINLDGAEQNICHNCVYELCMRCVKNRRIGGGHRRSKWDSAFRRR